MATRSTALLWLYGTAVMLGWCQGSHIITTPRKWTVGETVQVCLFAVEGTRTSTTSDSNAVTLSLLSEDETQVLIGEKVITIPEGENEVCERLFVPHLSASRGSLQVKGSVKGQNLEYTKEITLSSYSSKTFIQTDKYIYKPGQEVQFRVLSLNGPFLKISSEDYPLIYVETPSGTRIAQWTGVDNSAGLIHLSLKLTDEPEEGVYNIIVRQMLGGPSTQRTFKVEEYVLPRFEVSVVPPKYVLGTDTMFTVTVCAKYTYGQPVKGNVTLEVDNQGWGSSKIIHKIHDKISGCKEIEVSAEDIQINGDDYYVYNIRMSATVTEEGTDVVLTGSASAEVSRTAINFKDDGKEEFIKPNLPYTGKVKVTFPDGSAAANEPMELCIGGSCKTLTTSPNGILQYILPYTAQNIMITAVNYQQVRSSQSTWRSIMYQSKYNKSLKKYYSPSNSSLVIHVPEGTLACDSTGQNHIIPVMFSSANQTKAKITVQVVSRGQIQFSKTEEYELSSGNLPVNEDYLIEPLPSPLPNTFRGYINIPVLLPRTASPSAKVVVWYSRDDGEVVSDTQTITVERCLENDVKLSWSNARVQPGEQATLNLEAEPQSLCSLGVVDKSVELLSSGNDDLTLDKVFNLVESAMVDEWENAQSNDYEHCRRWNMKNREPTPPLPGPPGPPGVRPQAVPFAPEELPAAGGRVKRGFGSFSDYVDAIKMFDKSGLYILTDLTVETRPCESQRIFPRRRYKSMARFSMKVKSPQEPAVFSAIAEKITIQEPTVLTSYVPETKNDPGIDLIRTHFPETLLWDIITIQSSGRISEQYTLPDTITEWVGKAVCVNFDKGIGISPRATITTFTPFFVDLTLPPSVKRGEILPVKISIFNYLDQDLPIKVVLEESSEYEILGNGQQSMCIQAQDKVVHTVKIRSLALGDVNITIDAFVDSLYPEVCGPEFVVNKRDVLIKPIKVEAEGFPREKAWTKYICSKDIVENADFLEQWRLQPPSDIVESSERAWVIAVGDLLGPTLEHLGSLVKMPYGCGEQNMLNFSPNIFILQYLDASNQTTQDIAKKAIEYMKKGYQRELNYRHTDGSYSAFGNSDESGSTWLTAFVLKSFAQARQYIQVDENDLDMSLDWLKRKQFENGCFESVGKLLHKDMKGGIGGSSSPAPLTAYVLISLLEAGEIPTSSAVTEAYYCLKADKSKDPYTIVLKAYALALSQVPEAEEVMQALLSLAVETSNSMYWEMPPGMSEAVAVETAGYAVLAMMTLDAEKYYTPARKIVKWISARRNSQGGFISTQDTVVALQALASFEGHQKKETLDLVVTVEAEGLEHAFFLDETNKLLQQQINIPVLPTNVIIDMEGGGCSLVQAVLRYNVHTPTASEAFALSVATETIPDKKCVTKKIKACASYLLNDEKSNMAVVEFDLISGYIPHKPDLKKIIGYGTGLLKRYEVDGSKVMFYVDEFSSQDICIEFRVIREIDVEDTKPGSVKVYDYYQPEFSVSQSYVLPPVDECVIEIVPIEAIAIEDEIIVGEVLYEDYEEEEPVPSAVSDLVAALDSIP